MISYKKNECNLKLSFYITRYRFLKNWTEKEEDKKTCPSWALNQVVPASNAAGLTIRSFNIY